MQVRISVPIYATLYFDTEKGSLDQIELDPQFGDAHYAEVYDNGEQIVGGDYTDMWGDSVTNVEFDKIPQRDGSTLWTNQRKIVTAHPALAAVTELQSQLTKEQWESAPIIWG